MNKEPKCFLPRWARSFAASRAAAPRWVICALLMAIIPVSLYAQPTGPPIILIQPSNQNVFAGGTVMITVSATGSDPLSYQWFKLPTGMIANATNATLTLPGVDEADSGTYFVRVTNIFGKVPSTNVSLMVLRADFGDAPAPYPTLLSEDGARHVIVPGVYLGAGISFEPDGQPDPSASLDTFDDGVTFLSALVPGTTCTVRVVASTNGFLDAWMDFNGNGSWSDPGEQIFNSLFLSPGAKMLTFSVPATVPTTTANLFARFRFSRSGGLRPTGLAADGEVEDYRVPLFPAAADLSVRAAITPNPISPTSNAQGHLSVTNAGPSAASNVWVTNTLPGVDFVSVQAGTTSCTIQGDTVICSIGNLPPGEARTILFSFHPRQRSVLTNVLTAGSDTFDPNPSNNQAVLVVRAAEALVITMPPQDVRVRVGDTAAFSVTAQGSGALTYQWFENGAAIAGATSSILTLFSVQGSATIQVQVADSFGTLLSPPAALEAVKPPVVITAPMPIPPVPTNTAAQFGVQADGTAPLQYQWRLNGANIPGATNRDYIIPNATRPDGGTYTVAIANDAGVIVSGPVLVTLPDFLKVSGSDNLVQAQLLLLPGTDPLQGGVVQGDNFNATREPGEPNHAGKPPFASVWYLWRAPATGIATFETVGSTFDTVLAVYEQTNSSNLDFSNLVEVAGDDDHGGYFRSLVRFNAIQDRTFAIVVDGFAGRQGLFLLGWKIEPTTQMLPVIITQPRSRSVPDGVALTLTVEATNNASANGQLFFQWLFNGAPITGANNSTLTIPSVKADRVGSYTVRILGSPGRFVESRAAIIEIGPVPGIQSEDKVENLFFPETASSGPNLKRTPKFLGGGPPFVSVAFGIPGSQIMNNTNSTADIDCFRIGSATRWLGIHVTNDPAGADSLLQVDTAGSAIMTELAVYRFVSLSCLELVPCLHTNLLGCDTNGGAGDTYSIVQFAPLLGGDYLVFADGLLGAQGVIEMNWQLGAPPLVDPAPSGCFLVVPAGTNVTLTAGITNNPVPAPSYQWFCSGALLPEATNSTLTFTPIQSTNAGVYTAVVSNLFGVSTNNCCVIVNPPHLRYQVDLTNSPALFNISAALLPGWIQSATNLSPPITWQNQVTNMTTNCNCQLAVPMRDTNGVPFPPRFYRARTP